MVVNDPNEVKIGVKVKPKYSLDKFIEEYQKLKPNSYSKSHKLINRIKKKHLNLINHNFRITKMPSSNYYKDECFVEVNIDDRKNWNGFWIPINLLKRHGSK